LGVAAVCVTVGIGATLAAGPSDVANSIEREAAEKVRSITIKLGLGDMG
jgi:hypothetical protein